MQYNYNFEIAAIIFMGVILLDFLIKKRFYRMSTQIFFVFLCASLLDSVFNVLSSILIAYADLVPVALNTAVAGIFFLLQSLDLYLFFLYTYILCRSNRNIRKAELAVLSLPFVVNTLFSLVSPFNGFYYYFNEQRQYCQGTGSMLSYLYIYVYIVLSFLYAIGYWKKLRKQDRLVILSYCAAFVLAIGIQISFKSMLLTGIARAFTVLLMYISMENPNDYIDKMTGIMNGYAFQTMVLSLMFKRKKFQVVYIDLDKYRYVNMAYGYENGDNLLCSVAQFLAESSPKNRAFRLNGDTFSIILDGRKKDTERLLQHVERRFTHPWKASAAEANLAATIVVLEYPEQFQELSSLNDLMKYLMKSVKSNHDTSLLYATEDTIEACNRIKKVESTLRRALYEHTLDVYYQPIHGKEAGEVAALEALARLTDEDGNMIPPDEFIQIAVDTGIISSLGDYVFEKVCSFIHEYLIPMEHCPVRKVQMNLSMIQCIQTNLPDKYIGIMKKYDVPAQMIDLEITERAALQSPDIVMNNMRRMIDYGITFSLDDYGTGNSNISYLIRFPFAQIKFDKTLIWSYFEKEDARIIIENEFHILQKLNKNIVVEGIETEQQSREMREKGIFYFQGFLFSKALSEKACMEYIKKTGKWDRRDTNNGDYSENSERNR